jgi:hypothetical protein
MKLEYTINNISGKNKSLCIGDMIKYYGETRYKMIEGVQKLNKSDTTKGMVAHLLKKAMKNPVVDAMFNNIEELANKQHFFLFTVDNIKPLLFDNGKNHCVMVVEMTEEYFAAKTIYDMMKPTLGVHKMEYEDYLHKEKGDWRKWFEKNLKEYTSDYSCKTLEE